MAHNVKHHPEKNLVIVKHTDQVDKHDLWDARLKILDCIKEKDSPRILVDMRDIILETTTMDRFEFAQSHNKYFPSSTKIATLMSKDDPNKSQHEFVETVSMNRGFMLRVFDDEHEAERWLLG